MRKKKLILFIAAMVTMMLVSGAWGARHALLMGAWKYPDLGVPPLEGPPNDVAVLENLLKKQHGFDSVITLTDGEMTRSGMLKAMKRLDTDTAAGDFILIYFSGHGTSAYDRDNKWGLDPYTGALLPNDFSHSGSISAAMNRAVIGTRDIRPILMRLEQKNRQILVLFDACYSGYSVRSMRSGMSRYVPLPLEDLSEDDKPGEYGSDTLKPPPYPYRNVIYMSASTSREMAWDVNLEMMLRVGKKTVDGKPHGAMTDSLIRALQGEADTNSDRQLTCNELFDYVRNTTARNYNQTPTLLYAKSNRAVLDQPLFGTRSAPRPDSAPSEKPDKGPLRVKLQKVSPSAEKAVKAISEIMIVSDGAYDILMTGEPLEKRAVQRKLFLYLPGGSLLAQGAQDETVEYLRRYTRVKRLIQHVYSDQTFNVSVHLIGEKGVFVKGEPIDFTVSSEVDAYILLINIEPGGAINVIYPYMKEELSPVRAGQPLSLADMCVVDGKSYGTEHIKVIGFKNRPPALEKLMGQNGFTPESPLFSELMSLVENPGSPASQMTIQIKTASSEDITWIEKE